jgi:hypothetical protein
MNIIASTPLPRQMRERVVHRLTLEPHAIGHVLGRGVPGVAVAAGAPQQPVPRSVAVAVARRHVLDLGWVPAPEQDRRQRVPRVLRVHEVLDRARAQLLEAPPEHVLPGGVQEGEAAVEGDRGQQIAGHLEQLLDPLSPRGHGVGARLLVGAAVLVGHRYGTSRPRLPAARPAGARLDALTTRNRLFLRAYGRQEAVVSGTETAPVPRR